MGLKFCPSLTFAVFISLCVCIGISPYLAHCLPKSPWRIHVSVPPSVHCRLPASLARLLWWSLIGSPTPLVASVLYQMNLFKLLISLKPSSGFLMLWGWNPNSCGDSQALHSPVLTVSPVSPWAHSLLLYLPATFAHLHFSVLSYTGCLHCVDPVSSSLLSETLLCLQMVVVVGLVAKSCPILATPWTVARQSPLSMGFPRQDYWSGFPFLSPGDLANPGLEPGSPALQAGSLLTESQWQLTFFRKSFSDIPIWIK